MNPSRKHPFAPILLLSLLAAVRLQPARAQSDTNACRTDYRNQVFTDTPTNALTTNLAQTASIAIYSGNIGDTPNSTNAFTSAKTNTPNSSWPSPGDSNTVYLTQSIIGQPVGVDGSFCAFHQWRGH